MNSDEGDYDKHDSDNDKLNMIVIMIMTMGRMMMLINNFPFEYTLYMYKGMQKCLKIIYIVIFYRVKLKHFKKFEDTTEALAGIYNIYDMFYLLLGEHRIFIV